MVTLTQEIRIEMAAGESLQLADLRDHLLVCDGGELRVSGQHGHGAALLAGGADWHIRDNADIAVIALRPAKLRLIRTQVLGGTVAASGGMDIRRRLDVSPLAALPVTALR